MKSGTCLVACLVQCLVFPSLALTGEFLQRDHALAAEQPATPVKPPKPMFGPEAGDLQTSQLHWDSGCLCLKIGYPYPSMSHERERDPKSAGELDADFSQLKWFG